jgi:vesicular inhibitory amino acid transporter
MAPRTNSFTQIVLDPLLHSSHPDKLELNNLVPLQTEMVRGGLSILTASIFLAGEMAGSGVLALPYAILGTGWPGLLLIIFFTVNSLFSGTRLGLCWVMLEDRYDEFKGEIRDPYPAIGEKAFGKIGRIVSLICICITLYGGGCVFIVLISQLLSGIMAAVNVHLTICMWMVVTATILTPLTWFGTPKDFWPIAVGALITTVIACVLIMVNVGEKSAQLDAIEYPPASANGFFQAFGSIMFAFAGASTFPTIQADMRDRSQFKYAAIFAILILFLIYFPMAAVGYFSLGSLVEDNIVLSMTDGWMKVTVEIMLLLHLITAFPIITNPPAQMFEEILGLPTTFSIKKCVFRSVSVFFLLFVAESIPSFGAILNLVGGSTVTLLTFVFPPLFYMRIADATIGVKAVQERKVALWERIYCWFLIIVGIAGGCMATYNAITSIAGSNFATPCYINSNVTVSGGGH